MAKRVQPRDLITGTLAKRVLSGQLQPGDLLPTEAKLCVSLGVSRTALRESMRTLAGKGLIESRKRVGTSVRPRTKWNMLDPELLGWWNEIEPDPSFVRALIEARQAIEPAAAGLAAKHATGQDLGLIQEGYEAMKAAPVDDLEAFVEADESFHLAILTASHNPVFASFGALIGSALTHSFRLTTPVSQNFRATLSIHGDVLEAIRLRSEDEARSAMLLLLEIAIADLRKAMESHGTDP
jgi:GntR family galactonate operon transcriptional repressor